MDNLTGFETFLIRLGRRERTIQRHCENVKRLTKANQDTLRSKQAFEEFIVPLKKGGYRNSTLNSLVATIRVWGLYTENKEFLDVKFFPKQATNKGILSDQEIQALLTLEPINGQSHADFHSWTVFFSIMAYTGARPGEIACLKPEYIDFGQEIIMIPPELTKTPNKPRILAIHPQIKRMLEEHVRGVEMGQYLFPSKRGGLARSGAGDAKHVGPGDWGYNFRKRRERLGLKRINLTSYSFRHSTATSLLANGVPLPDVSQLLGHSRIEQTMTYIHLSNMLVKKTIRKLPLGFKTLTKREKTHAMQGALDPFLQMDDEIHWKFSEDEIVISVK